MNIELAIKDLLFNWRYVACWVWLIIFVNLYLTFIAFRQQNKLKKYFLLEISVLMFIIIISLILFVANSYQ